MMIYSIARMSFTFALTLVARTSVNVVKTCTLSMENAEVIYQFRGNVSVHMLSKLESPLPSAFFKTPLARIKIIFLLLYCSWRQTIHNEQRSENDYSGTCKHVTLSAVPFPLPLPPPLPLPSPFPSPTFPFSPA